jgi:hypothetical protein
MAFDLGPETTRSTRRRAVSVALVLAGLAFFTARPARAAVADAAACNVDTVCSEDDACGTGTRCVEAGVCVVAWQLPCSTSADCGDGFTCVSADGGALCDDDVDGDVDGDANDANDGAEACVAFGVCTEMPATTCATPSDCQSGWSCALGAAGPFEDGGLCQPPGWTCSDESCEPPCLGGESDGGALNEGPDAALTTSPGYAGNPASACRCAFAGLNEGGGGLACFASAAIAGLLGRRRRRRG